MVQDNVDPHCSRARDYSCRGHMRPCHVENSTAPLMLWLYSLAAAIELRKGGPNTKEWHGSALRLSCCEAASGSKQMTFIRSLCRTCHARANRAVTGARLASQASVQVPSE